MPLKPICRPLCTFGTNVKSTKWRSNSVRKCALDTILLSQTICHSGKQFELFQIRWSSSSFTMSESFGLTKAETRNLSFKYESLYLIGGSPARTYRDTKCVDLIRPRLIVSKARFKSKNTAKSPCFYHCFPSIDLVK
jgi:hypothetical protein